MVTAAPEPKIAKAVTTFARDGSPLATNVEYHQPPPKLDPAMTALARLFNSPQFVYKLDPWWPSIDKARWPYSKSMEQPVRPLDPIDDLQARLARTISERNKADARAEYLQLEVDRLKKEKIAAIASLSRAEKAHDDLVDEHVALKDSASEVAGYAETLGDLCLAYADLLFCEPGRDSSGNSAIKNSLSSGEAVALDLLGTKTDDTRESLALALGTLEAIVGDEEDGE